MNKSKKLVDVFAFNGSNVLLKLVTFFEKRGLKIQSINLFKTEKSNITRFNMIILSNENELKKCCNQLFKFVETIDVKIS